MSTFPIAALAAVFALLPISILACQGRLERNALGWLLLAAAVVGGSLPAIVELQSGWRAGLAASLDVTVAAMLVVFAAAVILNAIALRLAALVGPYAILLLVLGWIASLFQTEPPVAAAPGAWFAGHVLLAIGAYAALTWPRSPRSASCWRSGRSRRGRTAGRPACCRLWRRPKRCRTRS